MKKTLDMLLKLKNVDIENVKLHKKNSDLSLFLIQLKADFALIAPTIYDKAKHEENLLNALIATSQTDFQAFTQESLNKLELIDEVFLTQYKYGDLAYEVYQDNYADLVGKIYADIHVIITMHQHKKYQENIVKQYMNGIISKFKQNNLPAVLQACAQFGAFLQNTFPRQTPGQLQNYFVNFHDCQCILPSLKSYSEFIALLDASTFVFMQDSAHYNHDDRFAIDALRKGLGVFGTLLQNQVDKLDREEKADRDAEALVRSFIQTNAEKITRARKIIDLIEKDCAQCKTRLYNIISKIAMKLPHFSIKYLIQATQEIDVDRLVDDLYRAGHFEHASSKLVEAVDSYQAIRRLQKSLTLHSNPFKILGSYKKEYDNEKTKMALANIPNATLEELRRVIGYLLVSVVANGPITTMRIFTSAYQLSPQQKVDKQTLKKAYKEHMNDRPRLR